MPVFTPVFEYDMNAYGRNDVDFRIQVAVPATGIFTLGRSKLNSTDVLGSTFVWQTYQDEIVELSYNEPLDVTSGIFTRPIAKTADIVLRTSALNPNLNSDIHPNTKVKLERKTIDDVDWQNLLTGFVSDVSVQYSYDAYPVTTLSIEDGMNRLLNAPISYTRSAGLLSDTMDNFMPLAITAAGLTDSLYTYTWQTVNPVYTGYVSTHGALSYSNTTVGQILNDLMDAELGNVQLVDTTFKARGRDAYNSVYLVGYTTYFDNFQIGYNKDYLFSDIVASLTSAPSTLYTKTNTDVSSFFGKIVQTVTVNLSDASELDKWMTSVVSRTPGLRVVSFSIPRFVPGAVVKITNDVAGETTPTIQQATSLTIYANATSLSTSMELFQPI